MRLLAPWKTLGKQRRGKARGLAGSEGNFQVGKVWCQKAGNESTVSPEIPRGNSHWIVMKWGMLLQGVCYKWI